MVTSIGAQGLENKNLGVRAGSLEGKKWAGIDSEGEEVTHLLLQSRTTHSIENLGQSSGWAQKVRTQSTFGVKGQRGRVTHPQAPVVSLVHRSRAEALSLVKL